MEERARATLDGLVEGIEYSGGKVAGSHLGLGRPDAEIVDHAEAIGAGLIVVGSRGFGPVRRSLVGSVSDSVVRHAHCPVMVVRGDAPSFPAKILLATDGSEEARLATSTAADLARSTASELHVVRVARMPMVFYQSPGAMVLAELPKRLEEGAEQEAKTSLEEQVQEVAKAGGKVEQAREGRVPRRGDRGACGEVGRRADRVGQPRARPLEEGSDGQRLRLRGQARPLPRSRGTPGALA
jgi:nucleotide-binding universal stress UspA family protein